MATVVGTPVDVDQVELLFVSLLIQSTRAMAEAGTAQPGSFDRSPRFRRSFLTSYAVRIGERLSAADAETTASYGSELVPVLRRQEEVVDAVYERLFPHTREATSTPDLRPAWLGCRARGRRSGQLRGGPPRRLTRRRHGQRSGHGWLTAPGRRRPDRDRSARPGSGR